MNNYQLRIINYELRMTNIKTYMIKENPNIKVLRNIKEKNLTTLNFLMVKK